MIADLPRFYHLRLAWAKWRSSKQAPQEREVWSPQTDMERAVYAALIVAGKPVTNDELARLMRVSKGQASKCVTALNGRVAKVRIGREVRLSIPHLPN